MNLERLLRKNIISLSAYSSARDEFKEVNEAFVFIDANENPNNNGYNRYPDPQQTAVKQKLAELRDLEINQILLGNGSDEVLDLIFRAFCEPNNDNIITLPPTYGMYSVLANLNAVEIREVLLSTEFQPKVNSILEQQDQRSKLLFLCTPNNPTANSFDNDLIESLLRSFNGIVVIDEAYIDFSINESWLSRLNEFPNLIVTQTFSKAFGLAGIRLGICYASKEIIAVLNKIKPPYNINQLTQNVALEKLERITNVKEEVNSIINERQTLISQLETIPLFVKIYPSDANFLLVQVDDANLRYRQLISKGIVVRNRTNQPLCHNCLRLTIGTPEENQKLITFLNQLS
ncbi:MAG: histidinol-phosphate transaminase [Winogradskyella sp.]|nr:histidinol-phosphate transaminase [Winogradskyella sp.]NNF86655.1 histidinol-phosphate transaminase [Winogradskyella sp.]NNK40081.1 histidinol-phosphate transaminase [Winogradskyella sp.]